MSSAVFAGASFAQGYDGYGPAACTSSGSSGYDGSGSCDNGTPDPQISVFPTSPRTGQPVQLSASSRGRGSTFAWDLDGDGAYDDAVGEDSPPQTYAADGTRFVSVQATDEYGRVGVSRREFDVHAANRVPKVSIGAPAYARVGTAVRVSAFGSDVDDTQLTVELDTDGNGTYDFTTSGTQVVAPAVMFGAAGTHTIVARVTDAAGAVALARATLEVRSANVAPFVSAYLYATSTRLRTNTDSTLYVSGEDLDGRIVKYEFDTNGDGTFETDRALSAQVVVNYATAGVRDVGVRVTDNDGATRHTVMRVAVSDVNEAPIVEIHRTVEFDGSRSLYASAFDADGSITQYAWDTDSDGVFDDLVGPNANFFPLDGLAPGTYEFAVRVTDNDGASATRHLAETIAAFGPVAVPLIFARDVASSSARLVAGQEASFQASQPSYEGFGVISYAWDTDQDGAFDDGPTTAGSDFEARKTFATAGDYTVSVRASRSDGATAVARRTFTVVPATGNRPPQINDVAATPQAPRVGTSVSLFAFASDAEGSVAAIAWDLDDDGDYDDGTGSSQTLPITAAGRFTVGVQATDNVGAASVMRRDFEAHVGNLAPRVFLYSSIGDARATAGVPLTISASGSDPDDSAQLQLEWDLDDDGVFTDRVDSSSFVSFARTFDTAGLQRIRVRATDPLGATTTALLLIDVVSAQGNHPPRLTYVSTQGRARTDQAVSLFAYATDAEQPCCQSPLAYAWDVDGDGFDDGAGSTLSTSFATAGVKQVRVRVTDAGGLEDIGLVAVDVRAENLAPTLSLTAEGRARVGQAQVLSIFARDPDTGGYVYGPAPGSGAAGMSITWDLDADGAFDDTPDVAASQFGSQTWVITHASTATRTIAARATDSDGATATRTIQIDPSTENLGPAVVIQLGRNPVVAGVSVRLFAQGSDSESAFFDSGLTYAWDLDGDGYDDGTSSYLDRVFATAGQKTVAVRVTDADGASSTSELTFRVGSAPPLADFTVTPATPDPAATVTLTSNATDADGTIATRRWDLDDDGAFDDATGAGATTSFPDAGQFRVGHEVVDGTNDVGIKYELITVGALGGDVPVASFTVSEPRRVDQQITFTSTSTDPQGNATITATEWDLDNDGQYDDATGATAATTFATTGVKVVRLRVTDADAHVATTSRTFTVVTNAAPVASFTRTPLVGTVGEPVTFTSTSTDADGTIAAIAWDLDDDGQYDDATTASTPKTFTTAGSKTVRLRVTDDEGASTTTFVVIDVVQGSPTAQFTIAPASPITGQTITFTSTSVDADGSIVSQAWDLDDDGAFDDASTLVASRSFPTAGDKRISLRVTDDDGRTATKSLLVRVRPDNFSPRDVALYASNPNPKIGVVITLTASATDPESEAMTFAFDLDGDGAYDDQDGASTTATTQFASAGARTLRVRVSDPRGGQSTASVAVDVNATNDAPVLYVSPDRDRKRRTAAGATFTLLGYAWDPDDSSYDPEGDPQYDDGIVDWAWDVNDDGDFGDAVDRTGVGLDQIIVTLGAGLTGEAVHSIPVRVRDAFGGVTTRVVQVTTYDGNAAPTGSVYHWPFDAQRNVAVNFSASAYDPDGDAVAIAWDLDNDGAFDDAAGATASHTFSTRGSKTVRLRLRDDVNPAGETVLTHMLEVAGARPVIAISSDPFAPEVGASATLTATASDPDGTIASLAWDLDNDGDFDDASGAQVSRTFPAGANRVAVRAIDNEGDRTIAIHTVVVHQPIQFDGEDAGIGTPEPTATNANGDPVNVTTTVDPSTGTVKVQIVRGTQSAQPGGCVELDYEFPILGAPSNVVFIERRPGVADERTAAIAILDGAGAPTGRWTVHLDCVQPATLLVEYDLPAAGGGVDHIGPVPVGSIELIDPQGVVYDRAEYDEYLADKGPVITDAERTDAREFAAIEGATVTLQRLAADGTTWQTVNPADPGISPNVNPQSTGSNGLYKWDVAAGTYRVSVTAPGYGAVTSDSAVIPPPKLDLHIPLEPNAAPQADFGVVGTARATLPVTLQSTASVANGVIALQEWDLDDDGHYDDATGATTTTTFTAAGDRIVRLRVRDLDGQVATATRTVTVAAAPDSGGGGVVVGPGPPAAGSATTPIMTPGVTTPIVTPPGPGKPAAPFSSSVGTINVKLKRLPTTGIPVRVTCSTACQATVVVTVDRSTARKLGLGRVLRLGSVKRTLAAGSATKLVVKLPAKAKPRIKRIKRLVVSVKVTIVAAGLASPAVKTVKVVIK